jgi:hypothetical protein
VTPISSSSDKTRRGRRYLLGMGAVLMLFLGFMALAPQDWRPSLWLALGLAMAVQVPLGVWLVACLGSDRFLAVWALGMLARLALVGVAGLALFPAFGWPAAPGLLSLVLLLMISLALEGVVLMLEFQQVPAP